LLWEWEGQLAGQSSQWRPVIHWHLDGWPCLPHCHEPQQYQRRIEWVNERIHSQPVCQKYKPTSHQAWRIKYQ
jgi:hypothetical protein